MSSGECTARKVLQKDAMNCKKKDQSCNWHLTWVCSCIDPIPNIICYKWCCSLNSTKVNSRSKIRRQWMEHLLIRIIQINCNMSICKEPNLLIASSTLHNGTQSPIGLKTSHLKIKTKQLLAEDVKFMNVLYINYLRVNLMHRKTLQTWSRRGHCLIIAKQVIWWIKEMVKWWSSQSKM